MRIAIQLSPETHEPFTKLLAKNELAARATVARRAFEVGVQTMLNPPPPPPEAPQVQCHVCGTTDREILFTATNARHRDDYQPPSRIRHYANCMALPEDEAERFARHRQQRRLARVRVERDLAEARKATLVADWEAMTPEDDERYEELQSARADLPPGKPFSGPAYDYAQLKEAVPVQGPSSAFAHDLHMVMDQAQAAADKQDAKELAMFANNTWVPTEEQIAAVAQQIAHLEGQEFSVNPVKYERLMADLKAEQPLSSDALPPYNGGPLHNPGKAAAEQPLTSDNECPVAANPFGEDE